MRISKMQVQKTTADLCVGPCPTSVRTAGAMVLLSIFTAGCLPFPHVERRASELNGTVVDAGLRPVRVKRVLPPYQILPGPVDTDRPLCERPGDEVIVDAAGNFHFEEQSRFYPVIVFYGVSSPSVTICIDAGNGLVEAWHEAFVGQAPPRRIALVCKPESVKQAIKCHGP